MFAIFTLCLVAQLLFADANTSLRGHMQPLGKHRPGPEDSIDEHNSSLSAETFYRQYVQKRRPVVIRGGARSWPAFKLWTDDYLKSEYGQLEVRLEEKEEGESDRLPAGKLGIGRDTLENFVSGYHAPDFNGYVVGELPSPMFKDVDVIPCMACGSLYHKIQEVNFWLTSKGAASAIHRDAFDAINCLLNGTKEWYFMDTKYSNEVYVVHRGKHELGGLSLVNAKQVNLEKYPKFADVEYAVLTVQPGDCLFVPSGYYHQVSSSGTKNMAVSVLFSREARKVVEFDTCDGKSQSKPLNKAGVYLPYPGKGVMSMGTLDFELFRNLVENFTLANGDRFDESVMCQVVRDLNAPAEGYKGTDDEDDDEVKQMNTLCSKLFRIMTRGQNKVLTAAELDALPLKMWMKMSFLMEPTDVANTYDFEYSVIAAVEVKSAIEEYFKEKDAMTKDDWLHLYQEAAGGSEYIGLKVFDELNPGKKQVLTRADVDMFSDKALEKFQEDDPRLTIQDSEEEMIRARAAHDDDADADDADDGDDDAEQDNEGREEQLLAEVEQPHTEL